MHTHLQSGLQTDTREFPKIAETAGGAERIVRPYSVAEAVGLALRVVSVIAPQPGMAGEAA
jgi:hypothetical protein